MTDVKGWDLTKTKAHDNIDTLQILETPSA